MMVRRSRRTGPGPTVALKILFGKTLLDLPVMISPGKEADLVWSDYVEILINDTLVSSLEGNTESNHTEGSAEGVPKDVIAFLHCSESEDLMDSSAPPKPDKNETPDDAMLSDSHPSLDEPGNTESNHTEGSAKDVCKDFIACPHCLESENQMGSSAPPEPDKKETPDDVMLYDPNPSLDEPMQANQCGTQIVPGGPVTWQAVNPGNSVVPPESQSKPKRRRGTSARTCTSIFQASLGVVLILTGIIVLSVVVASPSSYRPDNTNNVMQIENRDKRSWGIWCGALFIFTAAFGLFSRRSQVVISLYMAFSIFASLLAFCGIISACIQVGILAGAKDGLEHGSSYRDPCEPYRTLEIIADPSMECVPRSSCYEEICCVTKQEIENCVEKTRSKVIIHLVCYVIMLICFVVEFVVSIVGASFTCIGLECCSRNPPQHVVYYQTQAPQFTGQPGQPMVLPPGSQILPPQQYPVGLPPPAGAPMVQIAPMVQQTSPPQDEYLIPDAPPAYQPQINQQEYAYAVDTHPPPASAPPSYEAVNQGEGNGSNNDPLYITVVE